MGTVDEAARDAVEAMRTMYTRVVEGDWEGYRAMLADDYVSLGPDGQVKGPDRTVADWQDAVDVLELGITPEAVRESADGVVVIVARYVDRSRRGGEVREDTGTMMEVWTRTGGGQGGGADAWRCRATHFT